MISENEFKDKVVIVTGSAMSIGKAIAKKFYHCGSHVVISDINMVEGEKTSNSLGDRAKFIRCDISNQTHVNSLVKSTIKHFGKLDVMVNNAGVNSTGVGDRVTIDKYPDDTWHKIIDIDLNGTFYCCKIAAQAMMNQRAGTIINIASVAGVVALRLQVGFVAAKAAVLKMTEAMACELAPFGIRVNAVSPGSIVTDATNKLFYSKEGNFNEMAERVISFIPQGRPGKAEEIAETVAFLASESASYINGQNFVVDGGWIAGFNRDF